MKMKCKLKTPLHGSLPSNIKSQLTSALSIKLSVVAMRGCFHPALQSDDYLTLTTYK
jgi:hypothetical protein